MTSERCTFMKYVDCGGDETTATKLLNKLNGAEIDMLTFAERGEAPRRKHHRT
jgi:hypothetical protein